VTPVTCGGRNWEDERRLRGVGRELESGLFRECTTPSYKDLMRFFWSELIFGNTERRIGRKSMNLRKLIHNRPFDDRISVALCYLSSRWFVGDRGGRGRGAC
jgi:hypothetical protein